MKVYVVTSGEWSDFRIDAMFSTRKKADNYVDFRSFDEYDDCHGVTEYTLDECNYAPPKSMNVHGNFGDDALGDCDFDDGDELPWTFTVKHDKYGEYVEFTGSVAILPGEVASEYYERSKDIVIDKYEEWKAKRNG